MKTMTFYQWADKQCACSDGLAYLKRKPATWATWIQSCGAWRVWVCSRLGVAVCFDDEYTARGKQGCLCSLCQADYIRARARLNLPRTYAALKKHWETVVLPALRKAGVR